VDYANGKVTITFPATAAEGTKEPGPEDDPAQALVGKWYTRLYDANDATTTTTAAWYEFTSDGKVLMFGTPTYTYTASDGTITIKSDGRDAGTATYTITGTMLTIGSAGGSLANGTYYKAQETGAGDLSELVGSWEEEKGGAIRFVINADGSGKWSVYDCTWSVSGNRLTLTIPGLKSSSSIEYTVKDNTLTFTSGTAQGDSGYLADYAGKSLTKVPVSWKAVTDTTFTSSEYIRGIAYGDGKFVAVEGSGKAAYSEDGGVSWKAVTVPGFGNDTINAIASVGGKFVAGGNQGKAAYSEDGGETWTAVTVPGFSGNTINGIAYSDGKFVAVGWSRWAAYSEDGGETWAKVDDTEFSISAVIYGIAYGGGKFVAVGSRAEAAYSEDGKTWTKVADTGLGGSNPPTTIYGIAYGGKKFVAVGSGGKIAYSNDQE
jgi:hypothetical protein